MGAVDTARPGSPARLPRRPRPDPLDTSSGVLGAWAGLLGQPFPQLFDLLVLLAENLLHVPISCCLLEFLLQLLRSEKCQAMTKRVKESINKSDENVYFLL